MKYLMEDRDVDFVLWEQFSNEKLLTHKKYLSFDRKTCETILDEGRKFATEVMLPTLVESNKTGPTFENGAVKTPDGFKDAFELIKVNGWQTLGVPTQMYGQGAPSFIAAAVDQYFMAANWALNLHARMGIGIAAMIDYFGTADQKKLYVEKLVSAQWSATMLLTESQAGSDVGALETTATRNDDGTYAITGEKIFISNGDHDLCENIIHPVLARIKGAPAGTKGISIFLVPKYFVDTDGSMGDRNDVFCTGIERKHGLTASPTCSMSLGANGKCIGFLLGEENEGMKIMFRKLNSARMNTAQQSLSYASVAYLRAVEYARERVQMREVGQPHDAKPVAIINHPDVRRNLLSMKSYVAGMRSFFYYMHVQSELSQNAETKKERDLADGIFQFLTPVLKSYLSNRSYEVCVQAVQVHGGLGYTKGRVVEQYMRDCKAASIYEGACGIQAMDFLGRKLGLLNGNVFKTFTDAVRTTVDEAKLQPRIEVLAAHLERMIDRLSEVAAHIGKAAKGPEYKVAYAHSLPFLEVTGDTVMAWMNLWRAQVAIQKLNCSPSRKDIPFYEGQIFAAEFFIRTMVPTSIGRMETIVDMPASAIDIPEEAFGGF